MIARFRPNLGAKEIIAAWKCAPRQEAVSEFETEFARLMRVKHAVAFPYGRTGLIYLLKALGLEGKEIICPAYSCVVVPHAIVYSGNEPVFIDSRDFDYNMDLDLAESAINEKTGAIIATSIFGYPVDLDKLRKIKNRYPHIVVIQDCAHSYAAEWNGEPVHKAGEAAIFGLNISKIITSIFGGMVTTDDDLMAVRLRGLRDSYIKDPESMKSVQRKLYITAVCAAFSPPIYRLVNFLDRNRLLDSFTKYYDESLIDMPGDYLTGMTGAEANVGKVQVGKYQSIVEHRRRIAQFYSASLRDVAGLRLPPLLEGATYSHYVLRVENREELMNRLLREGVQLGNLIEYCIPEMNSYRKRPGSRFRYPVSKAMAREAVNLPLWVDECQGASICRSLSRGSHE